MNLVLPRPTRASARLAAGICAVGAAIAMAAPASADAPARIPVTETFVSVASDICAFPVTVTAEQTGFALFAADGASAIFHLTEQDTFTANGNTLTGLPYTFDIYFTLDSEGNIVHAYSTGQIVVVPIDQGVTFRAAGRFDFAATADFVVVPEAGGSQNLDAFCSALAS